MTGAPAHRRPVDDRSPNEAEIMAPANAVQARFEVRNLHKSYGQLKVLDDVNLAVDIGSFLTILGPSGSGKTTLLKVVAGFEQADSGAVLVSGKDISPLDPTVRNIGMVFQSYALFPHMTVRRNVGFPLRMRGVATREIDARVEEALDMVGLSTMAERLPRQLSGGQQQRVALARAIVFRPSLLLLDEPFGALDRKLREMLQLEVRRLQQRLGLTTLFITHDQEEALLMSDRVAVMDAGRIQQIARPADIYADPANQFVASFVGESNILPGELQTSGAKACFQVAKGPAIDLAGVPQGTGSRQDCRVLLRPEHLFEIAESDRDTPEIVRLATRVVEVVYLGNSIKYRVATPDGLELITRVSSARQLRGLDVGAPLHLGFYADNVRLVGLN
jgi:putative spermidine/putrescine transport system ATP-binding protein